MSVVHFVVPAGVDDPARVSGGNVYDLEVTAELRDAGWDVNLVRADGGWPHPDVAALSGLTEALSALDDGAVVLLDGLIGSAAPDVLEAESERLRLVVLVHLPLRDETGLPSEVAAALDEGEGRAMRSAAAVVTVAESTAQRLSAEHGLPLDAVHVAEPGARIADAAHGSPDGASELLCVASITPRKGPLVLVEALGELAELPGWRCRFVGPYGEAAYVAQVRAAIEAHGLAERITLVGPLAGAELAAAYAGADVTLLASDAENNPLVVHEAHVCGLPVIASDLPGVREAMGVTPAARYGIPGMLVPVGDVPAWTHALYAWLTRADLRSGLRTDARHRRARLPYWKEPAATIAAALRGEKAAHPTWPTVFTMPYPWPPA